MSSTIGPPGDGESPQLSDLEPPDAPSPPSLAGPPVTPEQRIFFYSSDEWERFIREWAMGLAPEYLQIKRLGGPNDKGVDVAAFKTQDGFEGGWDCFQGKHYAGALTLGDVLPEMLKVFLGVVGGHYTLPDKYAFLAPRGCGPQLNRLLSAPSKLRNRFLDAITQDASLVTALPSGVIDAVRNLASSTDFSMFQSVELIDALTTHRRTPYYVARFGGPLPGRPPAALPPEHLGGHETLYVAKLMDAYGEQRPAVTLQRETLASHPEFGDHFRRQRISFYSAEALRLYARDSVPEGTFDALQEDIYSGVVEIAEGPHDCGLDRLREVLTQSANVDLSAHVLVSVAHIDDRKGICHQLASKDRLTWTTNAD